MCDPTAFCPTSSWAFSFTLTYRRLLPRTPIYNWVMSLSENIWHVQHFQITNHHSRSGHCQAEAGSQEGSRVHCAPGTSISLHLHTSLLPTWWKGSQWKGEEILKRHWYFSLVSCLMMDAAGMCWVKWKEWHFQTISNDFAPPLPSFWSSAALPLQSPPLFSLAFYSRYSLPVSPSVQRIALKITSLLIPSFWSSSTWNIIVDIFLKWWLSTFCIVLFDFSLFRSPSLLSSSLCFFIFFELWKQILQIN